MKQMIVLTACVALLCGAVFAADLNGKYVSTMKFTPPNGGEERTITTTFDLKTEGGVITGTVTGGMRRGGDGPPPANPIKEGKIEGNKFTIKVVSQGRNGEVTMVYAGAIEGDTMKGTIAREGGQGEPRPFEAKKQ